MKLLISLLALCLSLAALADTSSLKLVLDQPEVEKLEQDLGMKGFSVLQVTDLYAKQGIVPRCPCESVEMKFIKHQDGNQSLKTYNISTTGFGTSLKVKIDEVKN